MAEYLAEAAADPVLREAIEISSPSLADQLAQVAVGAVLRPAALRRAAEAVGRYRLRMSTRPTPFGLMAAVAPARFDTAAKIRWAGGHRRLLRPDLGWLLPLLDRLRTDPAVLPGLLLVADQQAVVRGDRLVLPYLPERGVAAGADTAETQPVAERTVRATAVVRAAMTAAGAPVRHPELLAALAVEFPAAPAEAVANLVRALVEHGFLLTDLTPPASCPDLLGHVLDRLPVELPLHAELVGIGAQLDAAAEAGSGCGGELIREVRARMARLGPADRPIHADLALDAEIVLPDHVRTELEQAVTALWRLSPPTTGPEHLRSYHREFVERYGTDSPVPLTELLDPDTGLGPPAGYRRPVGGRGAANPQPSGERTDAEAARDRLLAELATGALADRGPDGRLPEVVLDDALLSRLVLPADEAAGRTADTPSASLELYAELAADSVEALDAGDYRLVISPMAGSDRAGATFGRFAALLAGGGGGAVASVAAEFGGGGGGGGGAVLGAALPARGGGAATSGAALPGGADGGAVLSAALSAGVGGDAEPGASAFTGIGGDEVSAVAMPVGGGGAVPGAAAFAGVGDAVLGAALSAGGGGGAAAGAAMPARGGDAVLSAAAFAGVDDVVAGAAMPAAVGGVAVSGDALPAGGGGAATPGASAFAGVGGGAVSGVAMPAGGGGTTSGAGLLMAEAAGVGDGEAVEVHLQFAPYRPRHANIALAPHWLGHRVVVSAFPEPGGPAVLPLDDLVVLADQERLAVFSRSLGREVRAGAHHALNQRAGAPNAARFLQEVMLGGQRPWQSWDWGAVSAAPALPRVRYGRVVLAPASWRLSAPVPDAAAPFEEWAEGLARWRRRWGVPAAVRLVSGDHRISLDLELPWHQRLLHSQARSSEPVLLQEELAPAGDAGWLCGPDGARTVELVVPMRRRPLPPAAPRRRRALPAPRSRGPELPGGPWLFARLAAVEARHDEILADRLPPLIAALPGEVDRWFFIRYRDPEPHLRLRFHGAPPALTAALLPTLHDWVADLRRAGLAADLRLESYQPEADRYGGPELLADAERVFQADSSVALVALRLIRAGRGPSRELLAAANAAATAQDFLAARPDGPPLVDWLTTVFPKSEHHHQAFRIHRRAALQVIGPDGPTAPAGGLLPADPALAEAWQRRATALAAYATRVPSAEVDSVLASLLHMGHNRLAGMDREAERRSYALARGAVEAHRARRARQ
ncbi:thiopeptide-type bacteriocin biosynthesis protein [Kitasatospora sp. NPDC059795]|uniref:thiopeptide-type bacteriocin biosynthesis protein n=1 Tax=Kitasatospora sp. NPDC059795 TaxID=3346949 RepID=UPI00365D98B1